VNALVVGAVTITRQTIYGGFIDGLSIGLLALGVVLIYRSSRVINFAVGAMGALSAALLALLVIQYHWSFWPAAIAAVLAGGAFAAAIEATVITRLFTAPRVIVMVATIGIAQLALGAQTALPTVSNAGADTPYPTAITGTWTIAGVRVRGAELSVLIAVPLITVALTWFLTRTDLGKAVRAAAANPDRARLSAINPKVLSTLVWTIGGVLSAVTLILLAGTSGTATGLTTIGPDTLSRVLAAALIARMVSFPKALAAGIAIGVAEAVIKYNTPTQGGLFDALLFVVVLVATFLISRRADRADDASFSFAARSKPIPERLRSIWWVRALPRLMGVLALMIAIAVPLLVTEPSRHFLYANVLLFALIALSLVVLTGWAGQVSLGQAAFAGIGALGFAALVNGNPLGLGYGTHRVVVNLPKFPPVLALIVMTGVCALIAAAIGTGALRVRGLLLAIVTFAFALAAQQYVFQLPFLSGGVGGGGSVFVQRPKIVSIDLTSQRAYYYVALIALTLAMVFVARLRRSGIGRAMIGVRDNADAAAAYTVSPARTKLMAFAVAGAIAGFGGALLGLLLSTISIGEVFTVNDSLQLIAVAVIGGVGSVAGPILGALWVVGIPAFWPSSLLIPLFTSSIGLLLLLMFCPGGLVQVGYSIRDALFAWLDRHLPAVVEATTPKPTTMPRARIERPSTPRPGGDVLTTVGVSVRFGGRVAVDDVAIRVGAHEVVGLVGSNGAGKTTLMNAIGGFVPAGGRVELLGKDVTDLAPERRARLGLGRTFQAARLFGDLTVRETLQLALEARHRTGFISTALFLPRGFRVDRQQRAEADEIIAFLGLGRYGERFCSELSTGTRRIVELGALLALDARVLCLDEPTAGVAQRETEAFAPLLLRIRAELDASLIVIEHDMPLIMSISDRVYCLEAGRVIAEGSPAEVRENPDVVASFLGTDQRAIDRSGATGTTATGSTGTRERTTSQPA
jgi:ABC-type branched-subunit amino acid transport system ATPase component/ABC-type branched-subunit amino acid transport system permease subunit